MKSGAKVSIKVELNHSKKIKGTDLKTEEA